MYIDGKVQISIEDFESLKAAAEAKEQAEKQTADMAKRIADIVMVKDADFEEEAVGYRGKNYQPVQQ